MFDVFLGFAFLASATVANKYALFMLSPSLMVGLRMLGAGLILFALYRKKTHRLKFSYFKHDWLMLLGISLLTMLVPALLKAYALKNMYASKAAFLASLDPFVTACYAYLLLSEKLSIKKVIGILLGFSGTFVLLFSTSNTEQSLTAWWIISYPEIAALLAMAIGRLGWMLLQTLVRSERYAPAEINGLLMIMSGVLAFVMPFVTSGIRALIGLVPFLDALIPAYTFEHAVEYLHVQPASTVMQVGVVAAIVYTIIIGNVIGYTMYANFLKHHSATFVSLAGFSVPLYTTLFSTLLLGEPLSGYFFLAASITFIGLMIFYYDEINRLNPGGQHPLQWLVKKLLRTP